MPLFSRTIAPSLSPNSNWKDAVTALSYFLLPWRWFQWKKGKHIDRFERAIKEYLPVEHAITFDSGRSALYAVLGAMGIEEGDEVIMQAFTCVVVPNAVLWHRAVPIYCDIEKESLNIDPTKIEALINEKTKAIIVQHTFGKPAAIEQILAIARKHELRVIEDCAHALGSEWKGQKLGTFADAAIFSLGRDKVISSVHGGFAVTNNNELGGQIRRIQQESPRTPCLRVFQHLMHPIVCSIVLPLYNVLHIGKIVLVIAQNLKLVSKVFLPGEKQSVPPAKITLQYPNALAHIACQQFRLLETFNEHRRKLARLYKEKLPNQELVNLETEREKHIYLRFSLLASNVDALKAQAKSQGIILGDWYDLPLAPKGVVNSNIHYQEGSCPIAEEVSKRIINLPTHPKVFAADVEKIVELFS